MVSIRKLAQLAGVSHITVSRALRNAKYVAPETKARIRALAEEYAYHLPDPSLASIEGTSRLLGCLVPFVATDYYGRILAGVMERAFRENYRVIVLETHGKLTQTQHALYVLIEHQVAGVLIGTGHEDTIPREPLLALLSHGIMPVSINHATTALPIASIGTDEAALAEHAVRYLMHFGHQRIGFVSFLPLERPCMRRQAIMQMFAQYQLDTRHLNRSQSERGAGGHRLAARADRHHRLQRSNGVDRFACLLARRLAGSAGYQRTRLREFRILCVYDPPADHHRATPARSWTPGRGSAVASADPQ